MDYCCLNVSACHCATCVLVLTLSTASLLITVDFLLLCLQPVFWQMNAATLWFVSSWLMSTRVQAFNFIEIIENKSVHFLDTSHSSALSLMDKTQTVNENKPWETWVLTTSLNSRPALWLTPEVFFFLAPVVKEGRVCADNHLWQNQAQIPVTFAHVGKESRWNMALPQLLMASVMQRMPIMFMTIPVLAWWWEGWGECVLSFKNHLWEKDVTTHTLVHMKSNTPAGHQTSFWFCGLFNENFIKTVKCTGNEMMQSADQM